MSKILILDFECNDPYLRSDIDLGEGWVFKVHHKEKSDYKVLMMSYILINKELNTKFSGTTADWEKVKKLISEADVLVAHNATYDMGALLSLGIPIKDKLIIDTIILSKLHRNNLMSHSLDILAKKYLKEEKGTNLLIDIVRKHDLYPLTKTELKAKEKKGAEWVRKPVPEPKLKQFAYNNFPLLMEVDYEKVADYCFLDVKLTEQLYSYFMRQTSHSKETLEYWSDLIKAGMKMRLKGVRIDLQRAREVHQSMIPIIAQYHKECFAIAGEEFNLNSPKDVPRVLKKLGLTTPVTATGRDSATSDYLTNLSHPIGEAIAKTRKIVKLDRDFIQKIVGVQSFTMGVTEQEAEQLHYGRIFPHLRLFGASATSRYSCSTPNVQQIPSKDEYLAPLVRSIFVAEDNEQFVSLDWANQEGRLQVHFAYKYGCTKADKMVNLYLKNPNLDMHQAVADMVGGIDRKLAKIINLGLPYGMGKAKLIKNLGRGEIEGDRILTTYFKNAPFLKELMVKCAEELKFKSYISTLDGVRLYKDDSIFRKGKEQDFSYKGINFISQGSGAAQIRKCLVAAYKLNLPVTMLVHDEVCMSVKSIEEAEKMKYIMENEVKLSIPFPAEIGIGSSWAEAKFGTNGKLQGVNNE